MGKIQIRGVLGTEILFVLMLFLLSGCVTPPKLKPLKPQARSSALDGVLVFRDLEQVDLDKDGKKEIVAIYTAGANSSGVKVIKFYGDKGDVIFERIFNTPNVKFAIKDNNPCLIVEVTEQATGCTTHRLKGVYRWDGKVFTFAGK